jgi:hypothetical protein
VNRLIVLCAAALAAGLAFSASVPGRADDSAASIAAGGLVPRREIRIVMAKEVLEISPTKVVVDYDFRNDTDQDVTTEVAFPVPPYANEYPEQDVADQSFQSFQLWVDGKPVHFEVEAKATLNGKDVTETLTANQIDIPTLGHFVEWLDASYTEQTDTKDFDKLSQPVKDQLLKAGLFEDDGGGFIRALWTANIQYHWTQTFPAHSTVHICHEYTPVEGSELMLPDTLKNVYGHKQPTGDADSQKYALHDMHLLEGLCPDPLFLSAMIARIEASSTGYGKYAHPRWVDFILTSANTWKQPIEDFTLTVERGKPEEEITRTFVSFCSPQNANVEKLDADHFQVHLTNFVPVAELRIGFFDVPMAKPAQTAPKK